MFEKILHGSLLASLILILSCSGANTIQPAGDTLPAEEITEVSLPDSQPDKDIASEDTAFDLPGQAEVLADTAEPPPEDDVETKGEFLDPCDSNDDCQYEWCISTQEYGNICTVPCVEDCPVEAISAL